MAPAQSQYILQQAEGDAIEYMGRIYSSAAQFEYMGREGFLRPTAQRAALPECSTLQFTDQSNACTAVNCILLFWPVTAVETVKSSRLEDS